MRDCATAGVPPTPSSRCREGGHSHQQEALALSPRGAASARTRCTRQSTLAENRSVLKPTEELMRSPVGPEGQACKWRGQGQHWDHTGVSSTDTPLTLGPGTQSSAPLLHGRRHRRRDCCQDFPGACLTVEPGSVDVAALEGGDSGTWLPCGEVRLPWQKGPPQGRSRRRCENTASEGPRTP